MPREEALPDAGAGLASRGVGKPTAAAARQRASPAAPAHSGDHKASSASTDDVEQQVIAPNDTAIKQEERQGAAAAAAAPPRLQPGGDQALPDVEAPLRITVDAKERLRWSPQLHQRFCQAVEELGGSPFAKPKDIVIKMNVVGLTLAHVKSHLQKYRQQEGVTYVPYSTRSTPSTRRQQQQQQRDSHAPPGGGTGAATSSDSEGPPAAKRARGPAAAGSRARSAEQPQPPQQPQAPGLARSDDGARAADAPVMCAPSPLPQIVEAGTAAPLAAQEQAVAAAPEGYATALTPLSALERDEALERLHALADLATAQLDELAAERGALEERAASLAPLHAALAALPAQPAWALAGGELRPRLDALLARQGHLAAAAAQHLQRGVALADEACALQLAARELLAHPALAQAAPPPAAAPAAMVAAALRAAVEQHGAPPGPGQAGVPSDLASLLAVMSAAAVGPGYQAPLPAPMAGRAGLAQLQHLYRSAAVLAAGQQG